MSLSPWENPFQPARLLPARPLPQTGRALPPFGRADFHFLYLAPNVGADYFFSAARLYWMTFKPIVLYNLRLVRYVPRRYVIAITSLARTDTALAVREDIADQFGEGVYHDPLVYDFVDDLRLTLEARASRNEPFGVPLRESTPAAP